MIPELFIDYMGEPKMCDTCKASVAPADVAPAKEPEVVGQVEVSVYFHGGLTIRDTMPLHSESESEARRKVRVVSGRVVTRLREYN